MPFLIISPFLKFSFAKRFVSSDSLVLDVHPMKREFDVGVCFGMN